MSRATFRVAEVADIPAISTIRTSVLENMATQEQLDAAGITLKSIADAIQTHSRIWLAEIDGLPAAFSMANGENGSIFAMFARPDFEGKGLGRRLMAEAEKFLFRDHETIWLTTGIDPNIRAHGFYQRLGWSQVGVADNGEIRYEKTRPKP